MKKVQKKNLNKPTKKEILRYVKRWDNYGVHAKTIHNLKYLHPELHKRYIELRKKQYFYFIGLNTDLTDLEYDILKRAIYTEISNVLELEYYKGNSLVEDVLYDKYRTNQEPGSLINKCSQIHKEEPIQNRKPKKISPSPVKKFYPNLYQIDQLKKEKPRLHREYVSLQKDRYLYYDNRNTMNSTQEYICKKYKIHSRIIKWAKKNYYNGKKSMTDQLYDQFKANLKPRHYLHSKSKHKNNEAKNSPVIDIRNKFLNKLDLNQARDIEQLWMKNGRFFYIIQDLQDDDYELHERYLNIKKNQFYYYRGVQPDMNNVDYEKEKFTVYKLIKLWETNNRKSGNNKLTDIAFSHFDQHKVKRTFLNHLSSNELVLPEDEDKDEMIFIQGKFLDQKDAEQRWNSYGENIYKIDNLKNENSKLHDKWIEICRKRYLYSRGITRAQTSERYIKDRFNITYAIIQWSKNNYYNGKKSMTDYRYDLLKSILHPRTVTNYQK